MSEQMRMEFNDPFKGREATVSKCQASRGLGGLSEMLSPMGDESKTTRFSGGLLFCKNTVYISQKRKKGKKRV